MQWGRIELETWMSVMFMTVQVICQMGMEGLDLIHKAGIDLVLQALILIGK